MKRVKDFINKLSENQFEIKNMYGDKPFAITESTPEASDIKILTIDFSNKATRYLDVNWLILILKEFYGDEYLIKAINEIRPYDVVKDREIKIGGNE